jgi:uncharacterized protein YbgA (DUF1722 family)/uncharacterized protein YbbK (DUF523 family)
MKAAAVPAEGTAATPIRIGVSACLLGNPVRFDSGHKRDGFLVEVFGRYVEWVTVCPEVELGLGIPRPTLRLQRDGDDIRLVMPKTGADYTAAMNDYAAKRAGLLAADGLCGFVLKKDSPSCGMERVKVYGSGGMPSKSGHGLFAAALMRRVPNLPVEEEGRLNDPPLRENFIERVFAYHRLREFFARRWTVGGLVALHTAHKLQLMAHAPQAYAALGRLVAQAKGAPRAPLHAQYEAAFMQALAVHATARRQVNVLQHIIGYFSKQLDAGARQELVSLIDDYRNQLVPLVVPLTLIRHYVRRFGITYLAGQTYLEPHPKELMLRNHV